MNPWLPFEWIVALRFLREGRTQSLFIVGGIAIGVGVIVFMSALLTGLQANFVRRVLTAQPHIQLLPPKEVARPLELDPATSDIAVAGASAGGVPPATARAPGAAAANPVAQPGGVRSGMIVQSPLQRIRSLDQWQAIVQWLRALPEVTVATPVAAGSALGARGDAVRSITLVGIEPDDYFRIVALPDKLVAGTARLTGTDILIGTELGSDLGVSVGDKLRVSTTGGRDVLLTVTGIVDLGNKGANQRSTFVALHTAQSLLGLVGGVSDIEVTVADVYAADRIAARITAATGVQADSWIATNAQFFSAVQAQVTANTTIRVFVGMSVAFGVASVLVVSVVQKAREIGILRAMGISRGQVMRVFLLQGALLGLGGAIAGCALGLVALALWQRFALNADGTPMFALTFEPALFVAALVIATVTGTVAALLPALSAARLDPVVAIRG